MTVLKQGTIWSKFSCRTGLIQSAVMKFSLIAAVVLLALAQGSFAQDANLEGLTQYFEEMKSKMTQMLSNPDLASQAQTALEDSRRKLEPLAAQVQEQLKTVATSMDEQMRPLAEQMQAQFQPMLENIQKQMEEVLQKITEQAKAIQQ